MSYRSTIFFALMLAIGCEQNTTPDAAQATQEQDSPTVETSDPINATEAITGTPDVERSDGLSLGTKVVGIIDGDTIDILVDGKETKRLRLNGIDAPETGQPFGKNAKQFLSDTIGGKFVRIVEHDQDRYSRTIADIYLPVADPLVNLPDMFLNRELVKRGLAWHYKQYSDDERLAQDEERARAGKLGLWSDPRHVAPWDWRKLSKDERDKLR